MTSAIRTCLSGMPAFLIMGICVPLLAADAPLSSPDELGPAAAVDTNKLVVPAARKTKPAKFDSFPQRLDYVHHNLTWAVQSGITHADAHFAEGPDLMPETPQSRFRLGLYMEGEYDEGVSVHFDPDFEAEIDMPNVERRWSVFLSTRDVGEMPGTDPSERERGAQLGMRRSLDRVPIDLDAGIKVRWPPEAFTRAIWRRRWKMGNWHVKPRIEGFYITDEGFGETCSLAFHRWMGGRRRGLFRSVSSQTWSEDTYGVEWRQTVVLAKVLSSLEKRTEDHVISHHNAGRGVGLRYTIYGHKSGSGIIDRHRFSLAYRRPLYSDWVFLEISPEVNWKNDDEWDAIPALRVGVDALFWGVAASQ